MRHLETHGAEEFFVRFGVYGKILRSAQNDQGAWKERFLPCSRMTVQEWHTDASRPICHPEARSAEGSFHRVWGDNGILRSAQNDRWEKGMRHFLRQVVSSATPKDSPQILLDNRIAAEMAEDCFYLSRLDIMDLHFAYVQ